MEIEKMDMLWELYKGVNNASCQIVRYEEIHNVVIFDKIKFIQEVDVMIKNLNEGIKNE